jgi:hypothetical protein
MHYFHGADSSINACLLFFREKWKFNPYTKVDLMETKLVKRFFMCESLIDPE